MIRKCGQIVTTDDKRTFTNFLGANKDMMRRDPIRGNDNMNAKLLDCTSGFHDRSADTRNCRLHVTIMIITFIMFSVKLSTLSAAIFLFVPIVLSLLSESYIRMLCSNNCLVSHGVVSDESDQY